jgi:dimethylhistidine N-methyltransferase
MTEANRIEFHDLHSSRDEFAQDVIDGLSQRPASVSPKYFYDAKGSKLFDAITELPEYYPTRTEIKLLKQHADEIARHVGTGSLLVEPGGGSCAKVHILLQGLKPCAYVPMDISRDHLHMAAQELAAQFPWLEIHAACTDFTREMQVPPSAPKGVRVAFFPGSSIGNFDPAGAALFLQSIATLVGAGGYLLIGVDLKKDHDILQAAYDDAAGVTAQFNLNLLARINRELDGDFDLSQWLHKALYNQHRGRIEMHLVSTSNQAVRIAGQTFNFARGETIHTENSYKYRADEFIELAVQAGFSSQEAWIDDNNLFSVQLFRVEASQ